MAQDSVDAMIDPLHDAFRANIIDAIKGLLADKGLKADLMDWRMLSPTSTCLSATDYDDWCNLLRDPLFLPPSTLQRLLKLRDSTAISPRSSGHVAIFYIRTFTLTVAQLQRVLHILISAKILFASRVLEWQRRIAIVPGDSLVYLRYSGTSQSENAFGRHQSDLRRTRGLKNDKVQILKDEKDKSAVYSWGSLAWMLHILKDTYPEVVSNCLIQEIPHLEIVIDPGHSPVFIREQLVICLIERGALNIAIGGTASSTLDTRDKALFQSLKTDLISNRYAATKEASDCIWLAIQNYARRVQLDAQARHLGPEMGTIVPQDWVNVIAEQATPRTLKNGRAILLMIGYCPPDKALKSMLPFWKCGLETPRVLLNLIENLSQWEEDLSETQRTRAETLVEEGLFPFVNFHPVGEADETGFEPALNVLRSYLQVVRPLIVVSMGYQVSDIGFRNFSPQPSHGLSRRKFSSSVGSLSIRSYADEATPLHHDDCYLIQIVSYHPGALSYGVSQQPMQRVFSMTMFKSLAHSIRSIEIVSSVERWLDQETNFYAQFKMAKDEIDQINDETRWKSPAERLASQLLRKNVAVQKTIANNRRGKVPVTSRPVRVTDLQKQVTASRPVSIVLKEHMLPESYFAGRQHLFKMTYRNGTVAASAVQMAREGLPLQRGDSLWLLDQFIRDIFPFGGSLICADPAVLPDVDSIWPKLGTFCSQSRFSRHPYAKYLGAMAREGGTSAITALNEALKILRESVHKQRLRKYLKEQQKQVRYTAFEIEASIPDNLRAKE